MGIHDKVWRLLSQIAIFYLRNINLYIYLCFQFRSVQLLSLVQLFVIPWTAACQASLSFTISWSLLKLMSIESVMPSNHLILCHPVLLLPSIFPSIRVLSNELALHISWQNYWSFSFNTSLSNEYSGLISFRIDWLDLLAVQRALKSFLQQQFEGINCLALSILCGPTLTSIPDYWKNYGFDYMDWRMEWQTTSAFLPWEPYEQYSMLLWYICVL